MHFWRHIYTELRNQAISQMIISKTIYYVYQCKVWKYTPLPDYTRVDCGRPRIYPGVDPELYPRGSLRQLPESTPPSQDLPPFIVILRSVFGSPYLSPSQNLSSLFKKFICATLPESIPPSQYVVVEKKGYILGERGRFWEGLTDKLVEKGGYILGGRVDSGSVKFNCGKG